MKWQVFEIATNEPVGKKYHNFNGAQAYCDGLNNITPWAYEVRAVKGGGQ